MAKGLSNRKVLDVAPPREVVLELLSFSGGENTIGEDQELKSNEARRIENWEAISLGGMKRVAGINEISDGGTAYAATANAAPELLIQHYEGTSTRIFLVLEGDLSYINGTSITEVDDAAFTAGKLCHGVSAGSKCWITNSTDNLQYATIGAGIATPTDQPSSARDRIYEHKSRLIAEGGGTTVYGSVAGKGNWAGANGWTTVGDAWNTDIPDVTQGCVPGWPSDGDITVFTHHGSYRLFNMPNIAWLPIIGSPGCSGPYTIARGTEGVFFYSRNPVKGIILWSGSQYINLTEFHDFVDDIDDTKDMFGIYKNNKYYFLYNETGSAVSYVNKLRIYNTKYGRWMERPINTSLGDNFGYPGLLPKTNNELYLASSRDSKVYELETGTEDEGYPTKAVYETKDFSSRDWSIGSGGQFPIDDVSIKLIKVTVTFYGTVGAVTLLGTGDRGRISVSKVIDLTAEGAKINSDFTVNTSKVISSSDLPNKTQTFTFNNSAVAKRWSFQVLNEGTSTQPEISKIKIHGVAVEEE